MFVIRLADINIRINSDNEKLMNFFKDYLIEDAFEFSVEIKDEDIENERKLNVNSYNEFELLKLGIYRKIAEIIPKYNAFLIHGSALYIDDNASLLTGKSGVGKSTHAKLLRQYYEAKMINDDKPLIRIIGGIPYIYGTPYNGKHHLSANVKKKLENIIFIKQDKDNRIVQMSNSESFPLIYSQVYQPYNKESLIKTIELVNVLNNYTNNYCLYCDISKDAAFTSYKVIKCSTQ